MIALIQRVTEASVTVDGRVSGAIGRGMLILLGVAMHDTEQEAAWLARKCAMLRIFSDASGKMNRSLIDSDGEALVVSQFTLCADTRRGHRPSFARAAPPGAAEQLYDAFINQLETYLDTPVQSGVFGASMDVRLLNSGPVTLSLERRPPRILPDDMGDGGDPLSLQ